MSIITVQDMRDEGVTEAYASNARVQDAIDEAMLELTDLTGNIFEPTMLTLLLDGRDSKVLRMPHPICSITSVAIINSDGSVYDTLTAGLDFVAYNRHLTEQLRNPDDRRYPRLEVQPTAYSRPGLVNDVFALMSGRWAYFPKAPQAVRVIGVFGWTDYSATVDPAHPSNLLYPNGVTPKRIKRAMKMMVLPKLPKITDYAAREDTQRWRLTGERTREQSYTRKIGGSLGEVGPITGDSELDAILIDFLAPPQMGAA